MRVAAASVLLCAATAAYACPHEAALSDECAIIGAVAKELHKLDERVSPPLREGAGYMPQCPWSEMGLKITPPDPDTRGRVRWVNFWKPRIDGDTAKIRTGIMHGPLAGQGSQCTLVHEADGWRVKSCLRTWAS